MGKKNKSFSEISKWANIIERLRKVSLEIDSMPNEKIHFPELILSDNQENMIFRAASNIAKHGSSDKGHKVGTKELAALIHYIADMVEQ